MAIGIRPTRFKVLDDRFTTPDMRDHWSWWIELVAPQNKYLIRGRFSNSALNRKGKWVRCSPRGTSYSNGRYVTLYTYDEAVEQVNKYYPQQTMSHAGACRMNLTLEQAVELEQDFYGTIRKWAAEDPEYDKFMRESRPEFFEEGK